MRLGCKNNHRWYTEHINSLCPQCGKDGNVLPPEKVFYNLQMLSKLNWEWVERMGWHNKTTLEALALLSSEVGEAINECRGEHPTDNFAEELADIFLRLSDLAYNHHIDLEAEVIRKMGINESRGTRGRLK